METTAPMRVVVVHGHGGRSPLSAECVRRIRRATRIQADAVILCGAEEAIGMFRVWERLGGTSQGVWLDGLSRDTCENVHYALLLAGYLGVTEIVVVTSWWHIPRTRMYWEGAEWPVQYRASRGHPRYVWAEVKALFRQFESRRKDARFPPNSAGGT